MLRNAANLSRECCYAHSLFGYPREEWESLALHALEVAKLAAEFAGSFGWGGAGLAHAAGLLHYAGKVSAEFQAYIRGENTRRVDHSTKSARPATNLYGENAGRILALCIAGHHAGLADAEDLGRRLDPRMSSPTFRIAPIILQRPRKRRCVPPER